MRHLFLTLFQAKLTFESLESGVILYCWLFEFQDGNIPLFAAIEAGNQNVCRELLNHDAQEQIKYVREPLKDTALHLAGRKKDNDLVKLFIEAGAVVDGKNVGSII